MGCAPWQGEGQGGLEPQSPRPQSSEVLLICHSGHYERERERGQKLREWERKKNCRRKKNKRKWKKKREEIRKENGWRGKGKKNGNGRKKTGDVVKTENGREKNVVSGNKATNEGRGRKEKLNGKRERGKKDGRMNIREQ